VPHEQAALAKAIDEVLHSGAELVVVFGASAIGRQGATVIPARDRKRWAAASSIFGMPVDPGQSDADRRGARHAGDRRARGCARIAKGKWFFDWVLMRPAGGPLPVSRTDITGLGVGGLLMEIVTRPQPRAETGAGGKPHRRGHSRGRGARPAWAGPNKLLAEIGRPAAGPYRRPKKALALAWRGR